MPSQGAWGLGYKTGPPLLWEAQEDSRASRPTVVGIRMQKTAKMKGRYVEFRARDEMLWCDFRDTEQLNSRHLYR